MLLFIMCFYVEKISYYLELCGFLPKSVFSLPKCVCWLLAIKGSFLSL